MRKLIFFLLLLSIVGCGHQNVVDFDNHSTLTIEKRVEDTNVYEVINNIEDEDAVQQIMDIFKGAKWETSLDITMATEPDYRLNKYHIWITPNGDMLEIINRNNSYYVRLSEEDSAVLLKIMTTN
ncbi:hypothetical protein ACFSTA_03315 [Ornithinibacillus salinisoli]|uniref:Lipoprotein n=1 Tax=Ornithinibacillus salinisoli TaxID=1848459 RepID=A0ABW4VUU7_9BACI